MSVSPLAQVMTCCLTEPRDYLNQCWIFVSVILCHSVQLLMECLTYIFYNNFPNYFLNYWRIHKEQSIQCTYGLLFVLRCCGFLLVIYPTFRLTGPNSRAVCLICEYCKLDFQYQHYTKYLSNSWNSVCIEILGRTTYFYLTHDKIYLTLLHFNCTYPH